jgi:tRNA threonylcarbamoyladenosine biosynthesis protein TsaE
MNVGDMITLPSSEAQRSFGQDLGSKLEPGTILFLSGELGAGKTTLVSGMLEGMGFEGEVSSPTYALMHEYPTPKGLVLHVDAYRVRHKAELLEMGLEDYLERCTLSVLEWGEVYFEDFPEGWILQLEHQREGRKITRVR